MDRLTEEQLARAALLQSRNQNASGGLFLGTLEDVLARRSAGGGQSGAARTLLVAAAQHGQQASYPSARVANPANAAASNTNMNMAASLILPQYGNYHQNQQNTLSTHDVSSNTRIVPTVNGGGIDSNSILVRAGLVRAQGGLAENTENLLRNTLSSANIQQQGTTGGGAIPRIGVLPPASSSISMVGTGTGAGSTVFSNGFGSGRFLTNNGAGDGSNTISNLQSILTTSGAVPGSGRTMPATSYVPLLSSRSSASEVTSLQPSASGLTVTPTTRLVSIAGGIPYSTTIIPMASSISTLQSRNAIVGISQGSQQQGSEGEALTNRLQDTATGPHILRRNDILGTPNNLSNNIVPNTVPLNCNGVTTTSQSRSNNDGAFNSQQSILTFSTGGRIGVNTGVGEVFAAVPGMNMLIRQRQQSQLDSHGLSSITSPSSIATMNQQNFGLAASAARNEKAMWDHFYNMLKSFKDKNGHTHVPSSDVQLSEWVIEQRRFYRECKRCEKTEPEIERRKNLLEMLGGFACDKKPGNLWMTQYHLLKKFKEKFGHCHVPMHYKDDKKLGHWVNNQRQLYRKYHSNLPTSMNETRIELLEELGFAWVLGKDWKDKRKKDARRIEATGPDDETSSLQDNEAVSLNSSSSASDLGTPSPPPEEIDATPTNTDHPGNSANEFANDASSSEIQEQEVVDLTTFSNAPEGEENHRTATKRKRPQLPIIEVEGRTFSHILFSHSPGSFDDNSNSDSESEETRLMKKSRRVGKKRATYNTDKHWTKRFNDLVAFKNAHGHCSVPFQYMENKSLSYWVSNQRQKYKKWQNGEDTMTQARVDALNEIGFCWFKSKGKSKRKEETTGTQQQTTLCQLDSTLILEILSFLPAIQDIISFSHTSKLSQLMINDPEKSNDLFRQAYAYKFGKSRISSIGWFQPRSWQDIWKEIPNFNRSLATQTAIEEGTLIPSVENNFQSFKRSNNSIGVLERQKELQALLHDNAALVPIPNRSKYSSGYSGMLCFDITLPSSISHPDKVTVVRKEQIAVWGDFDGLRVCDSFEHIFDDSKSIHFQSVGENRTGRIRTILPSPPPLQSEGGNHHPRRPCLYLGCCSGAIIGIYPVPGSDKETLHSYGISAMAFGHKDEVTDLSLLHDAQSNRERKLLSAGRDGEVRCYPNAFSTRHQFEIHSRIPFCKSEAPLTCLECNGNESSFLIFTGDIEGRIVMWRPKSLYRDLSRLPSRDDYICEPVIKIPPLDLGYPVTKLALATNNTLVSGSSAGDIQVWDLASVKHGKRKRRSVSKAKSKPGLEQRFIIPIAHSGAISTIIFVGDTLLTTGGNDGFTKAWSLKNGSLIGSIVSCLGAESSALPSQNLDETEKLVYSSQNEIKCAVMSNFLREASLVSFCRDGSLSCWQYGSLSQQEYVEATCTRGVNKKCQFCEAQNDSGSASCKICHRKMNFNSDDGADASEGDSDESASSDEDDSENEYSWTCHQCNKTNTSFFTKCSSCYAWRSAADEENGD